MTELTAELEAARNDVEVTRGTTTQLLLRCDAVILEKEEEIAGLTSRLNAATADAAARVRDATERVDVIEREHSEVSTAVQQLAHALEAAVARCAAGAASTPPLQLSEGVSASTSAGVRSLQCLLEPVRALLHMAARSAAMDAQRPCMVDDDDAQCVASSVSSSTVSAVTGTDATLLSQTTAEVRCARMLSPSLIRARSLFVSLCL